MQHRVMEREKELHDVAADAGAEERVPHGLCAGGRIGLHGMDVTHGCRWHALPWCNPIIG